MENEPVQADSGAAAKVTAASQYVIFFVDGESFAVALAEVMEIIRMPELVRLPLSPPSLEGLANLRGSVLPIISARRLFSLPEVDHDDATRVVILDRGRPIGLVVDRVANVVTVEADRIETAATDCGGVGADMLLGMIKGVGDYGMVMILDTARLLESEFGGLSPASERTEDTATLDEGRLGRGDEIAGAAAGAAGRGRDVLQLVSFEVSGQEYALPISSVQEIVQIPERITRVPHAGRSVIGVMNLRNRLLPIVSLRGLFGLEQTELVDENRVVVVSLDAGAASVGLVMDRVKEVLRVAASGIDPMPPLLADDAELKELTSICRLDGGRRLVAILSAEAMFERSELRDAMADASDEEAMAVQGGDDTKEDGAIVDEEQFVVFRLMNEEYGVTIDTVQEIVRVPEQIASVPKTPDFIEGVINLRGTVIPLVDQRRRFGLPGSERNDRQRIVVFTIRGVRTGFIVDSVSEVMRIARAKIGPAPDMSESQRRIIRRVANLHEHKRMILLIDTDQMLAGEEVDGLQAMAA